MFLFDNINYPCVDGDQRDSRTLPIIYFAGEGMTTFAKEFTKVDGTYFT